MTEQCSTDFFDRCWNKSSPKFKHSLMQKVMNKGSILRIVNVVVPILLIFLMGVAMYFIRKMKYSK